MPDLPVACELREETEMELLVIGDLHIDAGFSPDVPSVPDSVAAIVCVGDVVSARARSATEGRAFLEKLAATGRDVLSVPGNHDVQVQETLTSGAGVYNLSAGGRVVEGVEFVGFGSDRFNDGTEVPYQRIPAFGDDAGTLWRWIRDRIDAHPGVDGSGSEERCDAELPAGDVADTTRYRNRRATLAAAVETSSPPRVLVSHVPPFNTSLDVIQTERSPLTGYHWGSLAVRSVLASMSVSMCLSGHIHESAGETLVGGTRCLNAGYRKAVHLRVDDAETGEILSWRDVSS
jgi:Icc-related predicted phosphoesterase